MLDPIHISSQYVSLTLLVTSLHEVILNDSSQDPDATLIISTYSNSSVFPHRTLSIAHTHTHIYNIIYEIIYKNKCNKIFLPRNNPNDDNNDHIKTIIMTMIIQITGQF